MLVRGAAWNAGRGALWLGVALVGCNAGPGGESLTAGQGPGLASGAERAGDASAPIQAPRGDGGQGGASAAEGDGGATSMSVGGAGDGARDGVGAGGSGGGGVGAPEDDHAMEDDGGAGGAGESGEPWEGDPPDEFGGSVGQVATDRDAGTPGGPDAGDTPPVAMSCEEGAARCSEASGRRERCEGGVWEAEDFECARSVRVNSGDGAPCAVKANGAFICWWGRQRLQLWDDIVAPASFGALHSVQSAGGAGVFLSLDGRLVDPEGNQVEDVEQFDATSSEVCWVTAAGEARCSVSGLITEQLAVQVSHATGLRCALQQDGQAICVDSVQGTWTAEGEYSAISASPYHVCGLDQQGSLSCSNRNTDPPARSTPLEGHFSRLATADQGVCALTPAGELQCSTFEVGDAYTVPGSYTDLDAGDASVCAIRDDGSVSCWQFSDPLGEQEAWYIPEGW